MTDWEKLAAALAPDIPAEELNSVTAPLARLEQAFEPLAARIPLEVEPVIIFRCRPEDYR